MRNLPKLCNKGINKKDILNTWEKMNDIRKVAWYVGFKKSIQCTEKCAIARKYKLYNLTDIWFLTEYGASNCLKKLVSKCPILRDYLEVTKIEYEEGGENE